MPKVEYRLDVGHIVTILITIVGLVVSWVSLSTDVSYVKKEVDRLRPMEERVIRLEQEIMDRTGGGYPVSKRVDALK